MERNEGTWDKRFNVHRRRFGRLGDWEDSMDAKRNGTGRNF